MRLNFFPGFLAGCLVLTSGLLAGCGGGGDGGSASTGNSADAPGKPANTAPTVAGSPGASAVVGQAYSFQPSANDADGDKLTFTVANLPAWAAFNSETGRISGTPSATQVGAYGNISISVSDGTASATLTPFSINVSDVGTGSASLSWTAPTQNTNGSDLSDLAGFQVLYGQSAGNLDRAVNIDNPTVDRYVVENLSSGTWYFAVVAVNRAGLSSVLSNTATKNVTS